MSHFCPLKQHAAAMCYVHFFSCSSTDSSPLITEVAEEWPSREIISCFMYILWNSKTGRPEHRSWSKQEGPVIIVIVIAAAATISTDQGCHTGLCRVYVMSETINQSVSDTPGALPTDSGRWWSINQATAACTPFHRDTRHWANGCCVVAAVVVSSWLFGYSFVFLMIRSKAQSIIDWWISQACLWRPHLLTDCVGKSISDWLTDWLVLALGNVYTCSNQSPVSQLIRSAIMLGICDVTDWLISDAQFGDQ